VIGTHSTVWGNKLLYGHLSAEWGLAMRDYSNLVPLHAGKSLVHVLYICYMKIHLTDCNSTVLYAWSESHSRYEEPAAGYIGSQQSGVRLPY